ncbi:hypothetical protein KSS87_009028 [Heliosperma pusillum]|nr:hypothetical protein KSS87_009028 [Heliosperma pusillum]
MEMKEKSNKKGINLLDLPEGCLSHILSLTSPLYILRCSLVCKLFYSLSKSNFVWDKFLPSDLDHSIIQRSLSFSSKKHLVLYLCRSSILLEGTKSVSLDKWTGKKCYMLGARELTIYGSDYPNCWKWKPLTDARFPEVAELTGLSQLQITGKIRTQLLSPNTTYHAYFCFKLRSWSRGFDVCPVKVSVSMFDSSGAYLAGSSSNVSRTFYLKPQEFDTSRLDILDDEETFGNGRDNERWIKIDMGKYFNCSDNNVDLLEMTLTGPDLGFIKSGLVVHVLVTIHMCIVGRAFSRGFGGEGFLQRGSVPIIKGIGMNLQDLKKLPCFEYKEGGDKASSSKDCAVCLDNFKVGDKCRILPNCDHWFHVHCVDMWLMKAPFCPLCRSNAKPTPETRESVIDGQRSTPSTVVDDLL